MVKERYRWVIESIIYCAAIMLGVIVVTFYFGSFFTIPAEIAGINPKDAALMIGIIYIAMEAGFLTPMLIGWSKEMTGSLKSGLLWSSLVGFLMFILPIFLKETGPKAKGR